MALRLKSTQFPELLIKLGDNIPHSYKEYAHVKNILEGRWSGVEFYVDRWPDFTALLIRPNPQNHQIKYTAHFYFVYGNNPQALKRLLTHDSLINWSSKAVFGAVPCQFWSVLDNLLIEKKGELVKDPVGIVHNVTKEDLVLYPVPNNMILKKLNAEDASDLYKGNPAYERKEHVLEYCQMMTSRFRSLALISKEDNHVAGVVSQTFYGTIGLLFVHEKYRRKGYGKVLLSNLAKLLLDDDQPFVSVVLENNPPSKSLHVSVGFKPTGLKIKWFRFKPKPVSDDDI